jgi:sugar fermentation stimulation protein A
LNFPDPLLEATFLERANRFACWVEREGRREKTHLPNSGRLRELLVPGASVLMAKAAAPHRKTESDMLVVVQGERLVSVDARLPGHLVDEALREGALAPFRGYPRIQREVRFGGSRLDFLLGGEGGACFLEVKSVTLVRGGLALFPDAPTLRGQRHLETLMEARRRGYGAAVAFVVQREDARAFSPNDGTDLAFGSALREAWRRGVGVYAYGCQVGRKEIRIVRELPVQGIFDPALKEAVHGPGTPR